MVDPPFAAVVETHISVVFFVGDRAYKLKKPVRFPFIDLSSGEARAELCRREVELNRRLAPDVYLGVAEVTGPAPDVHESLVVMRRMPDDRRLTRLVEAGDASCGPAVDALAALLADFHARAERSDEITAAGTADAVLARWVENFDEIRPFRGSGVDATTFDHCEDLVGRFVAGRRPLFEARAAAGMVCDGHGDLQTDDVFCLDDGPRVLDCIEFNDEFRYADVVDDVAFLAMDLERLGAPALAQRFLVAYEAAAGQELPPSLVHVGIAYRAQVRAKVACLRGAQLGPSPEGRAAVAKADALMQLCARRLDAARVRLIVVGGLPGTGKSTVAGELAVRHGFDLIRSDAVRRARFGAGRYEAEVTDAVYGAMLGEAEELLGLGRSVVLDATFADGRHRAAARRIAEATHSEMWELRCTVDAEVAAARITRRLAGGSDLSEATPEVARAMRERADPWPESVAVPTGGSVDEAVAVAAAGVGLS